MQTFIGNVNPLNIEVAVPQSSGMLPSEAEELLGYWEN